MSDYIKREDALKAVKRVCHDNRCLSFIEHINKIPSTDVVERKRGKWIDDDKHNHKYHRCSICGHGRFNWGKDNFCPNCGADMRERKDNE